MGSPFNELGSLYDQEWVNLGMPAITKVAVVIMLTSFLSDFIVLETLLGFHTEVFMITP